MSQTLTRRNMLKTTGLGALALAGGGCSTLMLEAAEKEAGGRDYSLPPLPYAYNALAPVIDEQILRIHHDKHHAGYVKGLNATLDKLEKARAEGDMANIKALSRALAYHGSGHVLHTIYWESMTSGGSREPSGALRKAIDRDFGSLKALKEQFAAASKTVEASGWTLLAYEPMGGRLIVLQVEKHENLTMWGVAPILVCDVWEHAYYLQYKNDRGAYVDAYMKIIDWPAVERRFAKVTK